MTRDAATADHTFGGVSIIRADAYGYHGWRDLLVLIRAAFAPMNGRIDPPSSALGLTPDDLRLRAARETLFIAERDGRLAGCLFLAARSGYHYIGKFAVTPALQRTGIGRRLLEAAEAAARSAGSPAIMLETRVELVENHAAFRRMGFHEVGRTAHPGYTRPTSVTMRKSLQP